MARRHAADPLAAAIGLRHGLNRQLTAISRCVWIAAKSEVRELLWLGASAIGGVHVAEHRKVGSVLYRDAGEGYFEQRGLRRHAGVWSLWALGVAAVISGDFSGWNFGIGVGGWGGLVVATVAITVMYVGLC